MVNKFILGFIFLLNISAAMAQKPEIASVTQNNASARDLININGNNFGTDPTDLKVFFGAVAGEIKSAGNQLIEVYVPAGATYDRISVLRLSSKLTGYSREKFFLNMRGTPGLSEADFAPQIDIDAESNVYDLCLCDLNADGKTDVASSTEGTTNIQILQNESVVGNISLDPQLFSVSARTLHITCGDLNGDGLPELLISQGQDLDRIYIVKNNGNFSFTLIQPVLRLTGRKVKRVGIADLDLDGKPEIIVTDKSTNVINVFKNQSSAGSFTFASPVNINVTGNDESTDALEIVDMNGDGLPELITSTFLTSASDVFILVNKSAGGNFNFNDVIKLESSNNVINVVAADFDRDGKQDVAVTRLLGGGVQIFRNTSGGSTLTFAAPVDVVTKQDPWGLTVSDFDGDSNPDMAVTSIRENFISVLSNQSSPGNIDFDVVFLPTNFIQRNIQAGDIDGDGKPDIIFTSVDNNRVTPPVISSKISLIRNRTCMVPQLTPLNPRTICTGVTVTLTATYGGVTRYEWRRDGNLVQSGPDHTYVVTTPGLYTATAVAEGDGCSEASNGVTVSVTAPGDGLNGTDPDARSNGPICTGDDLELGLNDVDATDYRWTGPAGFTANTREPVLQDFKLENAGAYIVEMLSGGCVALRDTVIVEGISLPEFVISYSGEPQICEGSSKVFTVSPPVSSGFSFQWVNETGSLPGEDGTSYQATMPGVYAVEVTSSHPGCSAQETAPVTVTTVTEPEATFTVPDKVCLGVITPVANTSSTDEDADVIYAWTFGTGDVSDSPMPEHTYSTTGAKSITLSISYNGVDGCTTQVSHQTEVISVAVPEIVETDLSVCPGDTVTLTIDPGFATILWSDGTQEASAEITSGGSYKVETIDTNGCASADSIIIQQKTAPTVTVTATKTIVALGEGTMLTASGANTYSWIPAESLSSTTDVSTTATPEITTTYTVTGTSNVTGCSAKDSIRIVVTGVALAISPPLLFTPNGDGDNETWVIPGIESYPDCTLTIFDGRGRRVFQKTGYNNDWNGESGNSALPEGVYYFVFGCAEGKPMTGSVTIVR